MKKQEALDYHSKGRKGKIEVTPTKPCMTQRDLSMAYTPGVAEPCREIEKDPDQAFNYTARGNLVAVVTNGTAVLGLGDIGPLAGKPVMEGKGVLFKRFADIDVFDIELNAKTAEDIIQACRYLEPTFGGINLEDIKAPECFEVERVLKEELNIPVFHDDQHGTAIISGAGLLNALELNGKRIEEVTMVVLGAGAAGLACADLYISLGMKKENITLVDSKGVVYKGRKKGMNKYKENFAVETDRRTLEDAMVGTDVFIGVSFKDLVTPEMLLSMAESPIVFAMANPDPEITYEKAVETRSDVIMATGRSDYPNQINNVLGFPFIFRGALDVRATQITQEMKIAATKALAQLAKEDVPDAVAKAYDTEMFHFGPEYIIPKPFDPRVLLWVAPAVAKAAMEGGVARIPIDDLDKYRDSLESILGRSRIVMRQVINRARRMPKRIVFPEGEHSRILRAAQIILDEKIAIPILIGDQDIINEKSKNLELDLKGAIFIKPDDSPMLERYAAELYELRKRKGITPDESKKMIHNKNIFGSMMVKMGDADGLISGLTQHYPDVIRPALQVIKVREGFKHVSGLYMMVFKDRTIFFADTTVNIDPDAETLTEIALCAAETVRRFEIQPRIAMLSFSNFGSVRHPKVDTVRRAVEMIKLRAPDLIVDGEMQADTAVVQDILDYSFPVSDLKEPANVLIFPDMQSGNIAYKLMARLSEAEAIGPILMGISKPVHVLQRGSSENDIVNMTAIAVMDAQLAEKNPTGNMR